MSCSWLGTVSGRFNTNYYEHKISHYLIINNIINMTSHPPFQELVRSCFIKISSYIAQYPVLGTAQSTLHFTPWQFIPTLYTSPPGSSFQHFTLHPLAVHSNTLHFTPWQFIPTLYTSPPGSSFQHFTLHPLAVHSNVISTSLGSIQPKTKTIRSHSHLCL